MTIPRILIVEDELKLANLLVDYFVNEGFQAHSMNRGDTVVAWLKKNEVDAVLLDIMLPGKDGMTICKEVRTFSDVPILMITARVEEIDRLLGLDFGADDYICKPFSPREVVARVKAVLRRVNAEMVVRKTWQLDSTRYTFSHEGISVGLTAIEFQMLSKLCADPGRIYSRQQLMEDMYKDHRIVSERTIDSHVKKLRAKLQIAIPGQDFIESVYGVGYRMIE